MEEAVEDKFVKIFYLVIDVLQKVHCMVCSEIRKVSAALKDNICDVDFIMFSSQIGFSESFAAKSVKLRGKEEMKKSEIDVCATSPN